MNKKDREELKRDQILKCCCRTAFLHADSSYKKPIRAQSGKDPKPCPPSPSHQAQERNGSIENKKRNTIIRKKERLTSVNWKEEHHQVDVKITSTSNRQPLQIQLRPKETVCSEDCRCTKTGGWWTA